MSPGAHDEFAFEERVEYELLRRGWTRGPRGYDAELGLATPELWEFVGKTQVKRFEKLIELHGGDFRLPRCGRSRSGSLTRSTRAGCLTCCGTG